jgi:hypothetical protein
MTKAVNTLCLILVGDQASGRDRVDPLGGVSDGEDARSKLLVARLRVCPFRLPWMSDAQQARPLNPSRVSAGFATRLFPSSMARAVVINP